MDSVLTQPSVADVRRLPLRAALRAPERVALAFFCYLALLGLLRPLALPQCAFLIALPPTLCALSWLETNSSRPWSRVTRDWVTLGLILVGYWSLEWFAGPPLLHWQAAWLAWDRELLGPLGLRRLLESAGSPGAFLLEAVYLCLYLIPPLAMGILYLVRAPRVHINRFLAVLLRGTFTVYALLPLFPVASPRVAFPGADLPAYESAPRLVNTWLLDHLDISTSVFPSGHVAVAFSAALGLFTVLRQRRRIWAAAFLAASLIYLATIYGRYHYAVDGLASICIVSAVCATHHLWIRRAG